MPSSWTVWKEETTPLDRLDEITPVLSSISASGYISEITKGEITWYSDEDCTAPLGNENEVFENGGTVYWKYTHTNSNFESDQTGEMTITISDSQPPTVSITGGTNDKTYGDVSFNLTASLKGATLSSNVSWNSSDSAVATVTESGSHNETATVTITGAGNATITATVAAYQGTGSGDEYPV